MDKAEAEERRTKIKEQFAFALMDGREERARGLFDAAIVLLPQLKPELESIESERHRRR